MQNVYKYKSPTNDEILRRLQILAEAQEIIEADAAQANNRDTNVETTLMEFTKRKESISAGLSRGLQCALQEPGLPGQAHFQEGRGGFKNFGEFATSVYQASAPGVIDIDSRLVMNAPTTYSSEGIGAEGGFLVPAEFRKEVWEKVAGEDSLLARTDQHKTSSNIIVFPADETAPWEVGEGIQCYWQKEGVEKKSSKVLLKEKTIRLNKLTALVPVTEELLEDAAGIDGYLKRKVGRVMASVVNLAIVQGNGAGEPLGILNASSLVTVDPESEQGADSILAENLIKMYSRLAPECVDSAVFLAHPSIRPELLGLKWADGGVVFPLFLPSQQLVKKPFSTLLGLPVIFSQACRPLGDVGDVILVDLSQYLTCVKGGGIRTDVSMHLWFDYDVVAYRFVLRMAGQPWWAAAITPRAGDQTLSWAIALAERAG